MYSIFPYIKNQATAVDTFKSEWPKPKNRSPEKLCLPEMVDIMGFSFARQHSVFDLTVSDGVIWIEPGCWYYYYALDLASHARAESQSEFIVAV